MTKTYTRNGKSGLIVYVVSFHNGRVISATSNYKKEDGFGGMDDCTRRLDPNGATVRKLTADD